MNAQNVFRGINYSWPLVVFLF